MCAQWSDPGKCRHNPLCVWDLKEFKCVQFSDADPMFPMFPPRGPGLPQRPPSSGSQNSNPQSSQPQTGFGSETSSQSGFAPFRPRPNPNFVSPRPLTPPFMPQPDCDRFFSPMMCKGRMHEGKACYWDFENRKV